MYPIPGQCPICHGDLFVERLTCTQCGTTINGNFTLQRLARLTAEQWLFVELFIRCEGKLNRMQEELDLSYPTIRNRLNEVIEALGYEIARESAEPADSRQSILNDLAQGKINVDDAVRMLKKGA